MTPSNRKPFIRTYLAIPSSAGDARRAAEQEAQRWGLNKSQIEDIGLVVSELSTNSIKFSGDEEFRLTVTPHNEDVVLVELWDASAVLPQRRHPAATDQSGRGLGIVEALCTAHGTRPDSAGKTTYALIPPR